ncbi:adenylate cyclase [Desulfosarcina ovata subsp. sediminis]|uniref:Diadenylate cyclase n=1 Tax=Desulfosarcina ovata subsp. sediminis TaxID=885957 RepID=A0A5K7ZYV0_9BACT|nr:diadenylate cyclase [Desulfosarcina ovata]BBO85301.1 adenylate cyclase [Desulfosarcina ovata subsp. sediminis]
MDPTPFSPGLRWQDIADILFNSYILFRLYVLFRGTNVIRMIIAIAMLWMTERLAVNMGLIVTSWAMQGIITAAALIIIIVFRNEIASVLQTRDFKSFFWGIPQRQVRTPVDIIVESVYELARRKLGALIVLPLKKGLEAVVQSGVVWQGKLSREMLLSIFWHGTPVHDGATIVQGDQITEVAAILPLSKRNDLPGNFGTRHRAAVGLAEQSDALVIVVSEERGRVTVFQEDKIIQINDNIELDRILREHAGEAADRGGMKRQTIELSIAAMICLLSITGIWFSFARGLETLVTLEVPVEFMNRDPKMEIFSASASSVSLQLSGSGSLIKSIRPDQVKVKLSLDNAVPGGNLVPISRNTITLPPGIQLKQVDPQALEVNLDVPVQKTVAIQAEWSGKLPKELILEEARLIPDKITIVGGSLMLKQIETIYTEKIPLDGITTGGTTTVSLVLPPSSLKLENGAKNRVEVVYKVKQRPASSS